MQKSVKSATLLGEPADPKQADLNTGRVLRSRALQTARTGWLLSGKGWGIVAAAAFAVACASVPRGASDANMANARSRSSPGAALFSGNCAGCHGERGESVASAPRIMGEGALPEYPRERNPNAEPSVGDPELIRLRAQTRPAGAPWRDPFRTAQDLYGYVSKKMPLPSEKAGSLSADQYWAIVNFMLLAHGVQLPPDGVSAANASSVKL